MRRLLLAILVAALAGRFAGAVHAQEIVHVDASARATPFPHFWERMFGSGHAELAMRETYLDDLRAVKKITGFEYVRFHGILDDELGVYTENERGEPVYNFTLVDRIYDGLLRNGVRPVVELSFMPRKLAFNPDALHPFWFKPNVSVPKSYDRWDGLIQALGNHLVERYGIDEVAQWYFEVWNEPNLDFWSGVPRQKTYFELYDHTARALKAVNPRLRVGGPATAAASWVDDFLAHAAKDRVPVDFVSSHGYADDTVENLLHTHESIPMDDRVCRAIGKVQGQIKASAMPKLPLFWTEWNVIGTGASRDTTFVGPALADTVRACDGKVAMMSFWTFSDEFEENGPSRKPFHGQFGLRASGGINKPSFYAFALLHQLGDERLANDSRHVIVTRDKSGALAIAAWNLVDPGEHESPRTIRLDLKGVAPDAGYDVQRVDDEHGNVLPVYASMGKPRYPTPAQIDAMNAATAPKAAEQGHLERGTLLLTLEPNALVLVTVHRN